MTILYGTSSHVRGVMREKDNELDKVRTYNFNLLPGPGNDTILFTMIGCVKSSLTLNQQVLNQYQLNLPINTSESTIDPAWLGMEART